MSCLALVKFQEFLVSKKLVPEKQAAFHAYWVNQFLSFSNGHSHLQMELRIHKFLEELREAKSGWQIRQADRAIRLYLYHFCDKKTLLTLGAAQTRVAGLTNIPDTMKKMRKMIRIKHYAYKTERTYLHWVRNFLRYLMETSPASLDPKNISSQDVKNYLSHLAIKRRVSSSTQNQAFHSLLFLFRNVLRIEWNDISTTFRAKRGQKLPVVLSEEEVRRLFQHLHGKNLFMLQLIYGTGLRLMELLRLRVKDIDFDMGLIYIRSSKGDKDRSSILPDRLKQPLREQCETVRKIHYHDLKRGYGEAALPNRLEQKYPKASKELGWQYVFPSAKLSIDPTCGKIRRYHAVEKSLQNAMKIAVQEAGLVKRASVHTLRHSFATHLIMNGVNIREVQELLGHKHVETTMIYTHVMRNLSNAPRSPLDTLYKEKGKAE